MTDASDTGAAGEGGVLEGLALVASAWAELPAGCTDAVPAADGEVAAMLAAGWDLLAFSPTGELVVELLDASGARVELVDGVPATWGVGRRGVVGAGVAHVEGCGASGGDAAGVRGASEGSGGAIEGARGASEGGGDGTRIPQATSHGAAAAAWGAPPGRRVAAMGLVPGPDGAMLRASCALVLRLPRLAVGAPDRVAHVLAFHGAMHGVERRALPTPARLAVALEALFAQVGEPTRPRGHVPWALGVAARVTEELRIVGGGPAG